MKNIKYADNLEITAECINGFNFELISSDFTAQKHYHKLMPHAEDAKNRGDLQVAKVFYLLSFISSLRLTPDSLNEPYRPFSQHSATLEAITNNDLILLRALLPHITSTDLKARIADLLWLLDSPRNIDDIHMAIELYGAREIDSNTWKVEVESYFERATRLALQLRRGGLSYLEGIERKLIESLKVGSNQSKFMYLWVCEFLNQFGLANSEMAHFTEVIYSKAESFLINKDYLAARQYLSFSAEVYRQLERPDKRQLSLIEIAKSFEHQGDGTNSGLSASHFYNQAIQAYRKVSKQYLTKHGLTDVVKEVQLKVRQANALSREQMVPIPIEFDDRSSLVTASEDYVSGIDSTPLALMHFAKTANPLNKIQILKESNDLMSQGFLHLLVTTTTLSEDDRVIAKKHTKDFITEDEKVGKGIPDTAFKIIDIQLIDIVESQILPALRGLLKEHRVSLSLLESLCRESPIVPSGRERLFAKALYEGFEYEFSTSIHLLTPQLEHFIRLSCKCNDLITTHYDGDGIEMEYGLGTLLKEPKTADILDEDLLFEFETILTDQRGPNLRNDVAHGLLCDDRSSRYPVVYLWWRTLRLIMDTLNIERTEH